MMGIHDFELKGIERLHELLRNSWTDAFFIAWDKVDTAWFLIISLAAVIYLYKRKEGVSLLFIFLISGMINGFLKILFHSPRPCQVDPMIAVVCHSSFGFPSGAAQTATLVMGVAFAKCKSELFKVFALLFAITLCFSRVYLGVHYFSDIAGGIAVGTALLVIYLKVFPLVEMRWPLFSISLSLILLLTGGVGLLPQAALAAGLGVGLSLSKGIVLAPTLLGRILTFAAAVLGALWLLALGEAYPNAQAALAFMAALWFMYAAPYFYQNLYRTCSEKR